MELMTYKTRALRTLSLLILVALIAALNPPSLTDSTAFAQATAPELTSSADTANQVDLSWTDVEDADDYELWRWEDTEGWVELDDSISGTSYADTGVTAGKTYYYQVSADGGTTWSNRVNETVGAYDASTLAAPTATSTAISLSWSAVTGAASYELWRFENSWTQVGGTLTATTYADASVEIGKTYFYQVMAKGPNGDGAWSNRVSDTVPSTTPGMPQNLNAAAGNAQVVLTWDEPVSNGGSALTGYQYRYQMTGGTWTSWMATSPALSRTATVSSLTNESAHTFEVQAMNANGAGATASASATPMSTPPGIPTGLGTTSTGPTEISLSWTAVDGAASYQLQRRSNGGAWGSPMDAGSGTTYTDMDLTPSTTYDYEVRAVNPAGSSEWSSVVTAATTAPEAPDAPSLDATASADKITLTWMEPAGNGAAITGYDLDVSDDGSDWSDLSAPAAGDTSADHENLTPGTMKYYRIRAMNSVGYSDWSASAMATVAAVAPGKPALTASAAGTTITLRWTSPSTTGGADITGYRLEYSTTGTSGWNQRATPAADVTSYDDTGLAAGTTRYYRIRAMNSVGSGAWSDVASATTGGAKPPAGAADDDTSPTSVDVDAVDHDADTASSTASVTITWDAPEDPPGDETVASYEVEQWNDSTQAWDPATDTDGDDNNLTATIAGLKGMTVYYFRVRAVFSGDDSIGKWSDQAMGTTDAVTPAAPKLTATKMGTDKVVLSWTLSEDGGSDIVQYELQRAPDSTGTPGTWAKVDTDDTNSADFTTVQAVVQTFTDPGRAANTPYHYRVRAANNAAGGEEVTNGERSAWSTPVSVTTGTGVPGKPTFGDPAVTEGSGTLTVTWLAPANDGGATIDSYELRRWDETIQDWVILQDSTELTYADSGLPGMTMKYYRVLAKNTHGVGPWSETVSGTTAAGVPGKPKLSATVNGMTSITLSWTRPADGGGEITGYTIQVSSDGTTFAPADDTNGVGLLEISETALTATHTGLTAGMTRHYKIVAVNGNGNSADSNTVMATTTSGGVPGQPTELTVTNNDPNDGVSSTTLFISWTAPTGDAAVTGYDLSVWRDGAWVSLRDDLPDIPTTYNHTGLTGGTTKYYSVRAKNANGAGPWSDVASAATEPGKPGKPVLTATATASDKISLSWTAPGNGGSGILEYQIQVSSNGSTGWDDLAADGNDTYTVAGDLTLTDTDALALSKATALSHTHTGLTGMIKRYYRVRAANGNDAAAAANQGPWSEMASARTPAGKPGKPTLAAAPNGSDKIDLTWGSPAVSNGGSAITGYQIQVWESGAWMDLMTVTATSYTHSDLAGNSSKTYHVRAMNAVGYGPWSDAMSATTAAGRPGAPVLVATANGSSEIRLTWTAPADGGTAIASYELQVSDDASTGWTSTPAVTTTAADERIAGGQRVRVVIATQRNYTHSEVDSAAMKYYRIRAVNSTADPIPDSGRGPWSNVASATTTAGMPGKPTLNATASGTSLVNLAWTAPKSDGGAALTGYDLQYWDGSNGWMALASTAASATSYAHMHLDAGVTKYYRIRAKNAGGPGYWSTIKHATTATAVPNPPTLTAMADGQTKIMVAWTSGHDGGLPVTEYRLQVSSDRGSSWANLGSAMMDMTNMSYTHDKLVGGTTRHYRIRSMNSKGYSGWSPLASATTAVGKPGKPTLEAVGANRRVILDWSDPATATGGSSIRRYELQVWDSSLRRWSLLTSTAGTSYTHTGRTNGQLYFYRVRAVNAQGDGPWSTFKSATPGVQ